ncbi:MAG: ykrA1 [Herbinix sp.]|jgi:Cof subfamily protein (haloacid dehalogenase superfamily)|nr:ykrA1 [Herbinix sp.]
MNTKIIFFDIDGTILSHRNYHISDSTKAAIKKAQANGHLAFINTGRTIAEIEDEITDVGFDGYVCGCGTYISYQGKVLLQSTIPKDRIPMLINDIRTYQIDAILEGSTAIYYDNLPLSTRIKKLHDRQLNIHKFNVQSWDDPNISFDKFCIWSTLPEASSYICEKYKDIFDFINRGDGLYEVIPKGHSKATGIEFLQSYLNISHDNTYALGDGANDLPMLEYTKHSIAMGNSSKDILGIVSFITEDVDQDGVALALKHFGII